MHIFFRGPKYDFPSGLDVNTLSCVDGSQLAWVHVKSFTVVLVDLMLTLLTLR